MPRRTEALFALISAIADDKGDLVRGLLKADPTLAREKLTSGAERGAERPFFFRRIAHYAYKGDTALHMAAAAFDAPTAAMLVDLGADVHARNRRGAEPLHYAADTNHWNPVAQRTTIDLLIAAGADPNALDNSGVAPLHRAVRTRSSHAVAALLAGGAEPALRNRGGSTPLDLATRPTGRGGAGAARARSEQAKIVDLLRSAPARRAPA